MSITTEKYDHSSVPKNRFKAWCGSIFYFHLLYQFPIIAFSYILYKCLYEKSLVAGALAGIILTYQFYFAKKSERLVRFIRWLKMPQIFKDWSCVMEEPLKENKSMIAFHPHCIFNIAFVWNNYLNYEIIPLASRMLFNVPLLGLIIRWLGVSSVDPETMKNHMKKGQNIGLLPGGFEEATLTSNKENRVYIKCRKGFIKYALQYGYTVYPAYAFGENKTYYTFEKFLSLRLLLNKFKLVGVFFISKFGWIPNHDLGINTVVGKGIELPHILNPTSQDVDKYHELYIQELVGLFDKFKKQYNQGDQKLAIY